MTAYRVTWEIDVEAESPNEAALMARQHQGPDTTALVFDVVKSGESAGVRVDLSELHITHLAVRALHLIEPDDWRTPEWDVIVKFSDGSLSYSEETFGSEREALAFLMSQDTERLLIDYWLDRSLSPLLTGDANWIEFKRGSNIVTSTCSNCGNEVGSVFGCPSGAEVCQACFDGGVG